MSEKHIPIHEQSETKRFTNAELKEHHERLKEHLEKQAEKDKASNNEKEAARAEVLELAQEQQESTPLVHEDTPAETSAARSEEKVHAFETIMHHARQNMSKPERTFSKVIHQPLVEKTSEALGKTVARPSGVIGATVAAFIGLLSIYSIAKFAGFELSGSEMPILLLIGFGIGLLCEWSFKTIRVIISPKNS